MPPSLEIRPSRPGRRLRVLAAVLWSASITGGLAAQPALGASVPGGPAVGASSAPVEAAGRLDQGLGTRLGAVVNDLRRHAGLTTLTLDARRLVPVAEARTLTMLREHRLALEVDAAGRNVADLLNAQGVRWSRGGEAVAWATGPRDVDPLSGIVVGMLSDPQTRSLVLTPGSTDLGIAVGLLDDGASVRLPPREAASVPATPRLAVATIIVVEKSGPSAPRLAVPSPTVRSGSAVGIVVEPDGIGRLSVVITSLDGDLLAIVAWNRSVRGRTSLRWDGLVDGRPAAAGTYQVRAFTVDAKGQASDPARATVTVAR